MSTTTDRSPRAVWQRCVTAAMSGDITAQTRFYAADAVLEFPFLPGDAIPNRFEGREAIGEAFAKLHDIVAATETVIDRDASSATVFATDDPEVVIAEIELAVRHGGSPSVNRYVHIARVRDGEIVAMRDYFAPTVTAVVRRAFGG